MPNLSRIMQPDPVAYTATLGTESVTITFDRARMTGRWERDITHAIAADDADTVADRILGIFIAWDVTDDNGQPVPISNDILLDLPNRALMALFTGMRKVALPASEEGNVSSGPSSTASTDSTPPAMTPQNGAVTSPSPELSTSPSPT